MRRLVDDWPADGATTATDADRIAARIGAGNAQRIHGLQPADLGG
jgi:hypothetical protein